MPLSTPIAALWPFDPTRCWRASAGGRLTSAAATWKLPSTTSEQQPTSTGLYRAAWGADYPTPENFLTPLLSTDAIGAGPNEPTTGDNRGRFSNSEFDDLLKEAKANPDEAARTKLYQEAETIAIGDNLALIPLWNRTQHRLANTDKFINMRMDFSENPDLSVISIK